MSKFLNDLIVIMLMAKTGCNVLDEIIGSYKGLTLIYGEASSGKTTLAKMAAIEYSKQGKVIFLDTENGFNIERLKQLTNDFDNVIKKIILIKVRNFFYQHKAIKEISSVKGVSLIIVDTIGNFYRMNVKKDYVKANAILGKQIMILKDLAKNIPILIINQVYSDLKSGLLNPTGGKIVVNNSDVIIRLEKKPRRLIVEKPFSKDMLFEIKKEGIVKI